MPGIMLTRRSLATLAGCALAAPVIRPARAGTRVWRLGTTLPPDSHVGAPLRHFADRVAAGTAGRIRVDLKWSSSIGGELEMMQGVAASILDCAFIAASPLGALVPAVALLDLPFVFRDVPHAYAVLDGAIGAELAAAVAAQHVTILGWAENGLRHVTANRAIPDAAALAGVRIRVAGNELMIEAFNAMGAVAGTVAWNRLHEELRTGRYEAEENSIGNFIAGRLQEVQKFIMLTAHTYSAAVLVASDDAMEDLSASDRDIIVQAAVEAGRMTRVEAQAYAEAGLSSLAQQGTVIIADVDRDSFKRALAPRLPAIGAKYGAATLERIRSLNA